MRLQRLHRELEEFSLSLSRGEIDAEPPPRDNYLAAGLKQLQAQMLHLAWQAGRVARGDYSQHIDFMGDFSNSFNDMINQLRLREADLRGQQEVIINIFDRLEPIFVVSEGEPGQVLYANKQAAERFGLTPGCEPDPGGLPQRALTMAGKDDGSELSDERTGKWFSVSTCSLPWGAHQSARLVLCRDITSHKDRETHLDMAANTDELTGIHNRRALEYAYKRLWDECVRSQRALSVLFFDIDHFKSFNDTYGHLNGDLVLVRFAQILNARVARADDVVARYGGEEFVALLPFTSLENAVMVAESVRQLVMETPLVLSGDGKAGAPVAITVSGGVASAVPTGEMDPASLIAAADSACYSAKGAGRNRIHAPSRAEAKWQNGQREKRISP